MPPLIHFKSAVLRRFLLLLVSPLYFLIIFGIRIGKCVDLTFFDSYDVFRAVWKGRVEEAELLPCPFCGGRANPDGWRANGGASGRHAISAGLRHGLPIPGIAVCRFRLSMSGKKSRIDCGSVSLSGTFLSRCFKSLPCIFLQQCGKNGFPAFCDSCYVVSGGFSDASIASC